MRVIKFRAWLPNQKRFEYWGVGDINGDESFFTGPPADYRAISTQFTGLLDRNGKEIYEGDILDFDDCVWGGLFTPEVVPSIDEFIKAWPLCGSFHDVAQYRRVIGSIYENPELMG